MSARTPSLFSRSWSFAFALLVFALATAGGSACGRSTLNDYLVADGGADGKADSDARPSDSGPCNATTCPSGCCDVAGQCQPGGSVTQCGTVGEACQNCQSEGFQFCDSTRHACGNKVGTCSPQDCSGCCEGNVCFAGGDPNECGGGGQACQHCQSAGLACSGQQCVQAACGPQNCKGCCFGNQCLAGTDQTACGATGQQCQNCAAKTQTCVSSGGVGGTCQTQTTCNPQNCAKGCCAGNVCMQGSSNIACGVGGQQCVDCATSNETCGGGKCLPPPPVCSPQTCPGCCSGNTCLPGNANSSCGAGGQTCVNCAGSNESCQGSQCVNVPPVCNAQNCPGCCDLGSNCQPGFVTTQCGQNGASCEDCSQLNPPSSCDVNVTPRTCASQQTQCPSPYPTCPANLETPTPTTQKVCSPTELQNVASACSGGAHSAACQSFFSFEQSQNPGCATCLSAFDYNFQELTGLFECVAPFVDATCNHETACIVDCTDSSCAQCNGAAATNQCKNQVRNGQCSGYYQGAQCIAPAFTGPGAFCNPNQYGNVGAWMAGVGRNYCGQ